MGHRFPSHGTMALLQAGTEAAADAGGGVESMDVSPKTSPAGNRRVPEPDPCIYQGFGLESKLCAGSPQVSQFKYVV